MTRQKWPWKTLSKYPRTKKRQAGERERWSGPLGGSSEYNLGPFWDLQSPYTDAASIFSSAVLPVAKSPLILLNSIQPTQSLCCFPASWDSLPYRRECQVMWMGWRVAGPVVGVFPARNALLGWAGWGYHSAAEAQVSEGFTARVWSLGWETRGNKKIPCRKGHYPGTFWSEAVQFATWKKTFTKLDSCCAGHWKYLVNNLHSMIQLHRSIKPPGLRTFFPYLNTSPPHEDPFARCEDICLVYNPLCLSLSNFSAVWIISHSQTSHLMSLLQKVL